MKQPRKNAPHRRPKHERRTENTRQTPHSHYTNGLRGTRADAAIFDEMPPRRHKMRHDGEDAWMGDLPDQAPSSKPFDMPPMDAEPPSGKAVAQVCAFVFGGFALLWGITWIYGHFRWGW